jgi:uncharacterized protein (DUF302 family)
MEALVSRGIKPVAVIHHSGEAEAVRLELRDIKVVTFGSPVSATPGVAARPRAALGRPLEVLVWAHDEETKLSYTGREELIAARYGLTDQLAERLAAIGAVADAVIGR